MTSARHLHLMRCLVGLVATILAEGWLTPSAACASCGDYVLIENHGSSGPARDQTLADTGIPKPCHGPHCSQAPRSTPLSNPHRMLPKSDEWGIVTAILSQPGLPSARLAIEDISVRAIAFGRGIFHPPR